MNTRQTQIRIAEKALELGQREVEGQIQLATASDGRATTVASLLSAASIAALGWAGWLFVEGAPLWLAASMASAGAVWAIAVGLAIAAAWPRPMYTAGAPPQTWIDDGALERGLLEVYLRAGRNVDEDIAENSRLLAANVRWFQGALLAAALAPIVAAVIATAVAALAPDDQESRGGPDAHAQADPPVAAVAQEAPCGAASFGLGR